MSYEPSDQMFFYVDQTFPITARVLEARGEGEILVGLFANDRLIAKRGCSPEEYEALLASNVLPGPRYIGILITAENETGLFGSVALLVQDPTDLPSAPSPQEAEGSEPWAQSVPNFPRETPQGGASETALPALFAVGRAFRPASARKFDNIADEATDMLNNLLFRAPPADAASSNEDVQAQIDRLLKSI